MTRQPALAEPAVDPRLARTLWQWLALGALALVVWPALRGQTDAIGWGPYWLVVAPLVALAVAYRHLLFAGAQSTDAEAATSHRRRSRTSRGQAQRAVVTRRERRLRVA